MLSLASTHHSQGRKPSNRLTFEAAVNDVWRVNKGLPSEFGIANCCGGVVFDVKINMLFIFLPTPFFLINK